VADFSGDGRLDLAFATEYGSPRFAVATGNADGTFGDPVYQDAEAIYDSGRVTSMAMDLPMSRPSATAAC